ncbi:MAG: hypothetical protein ACE5JM_15490 [Armatimonadota bacterium]
MVRAAEERAATHTKNAAMIVTRGPDPGYHYDPPSHVTIGRRMADAMLPLTRGGRIDHSRMSRRTRFATMTSTLTAAASLLLSGPASVEVWSDLAPDPVAVRYARATHPFGTLVGTGSSGLPAAPFRTDDWEWRDAPFGERNTPEYAEYQKWLMEQRKQAEAWARERQMQQARAALEANSAK